MVKVETRQKRAAGATEIADATLKGKIVEYVWFLKKRGCASSTIKKRSYNVRRLVKLGADLFDPESIKKTIASQENWGNGHKRNMMFAYDSFLKMIGGTWDRPRYKVPDTLPFIPLEKEIDALINGSAKVMACFLQGLKDSGADPGELARLEWTEVNYDAKSVTISHPVKGHDARVVRVSDAFLARLKTMPKKRSQVFSTVQCLRSNFENQRRRIARDRSNPRIKKISFTTLRHWKGTMEYHKTKDPYHVKKLLGHKHLSTTEVYINLEAAVFDELSNEFIVKVAKTLDQACDLVKTGFEYVTDMEDAKLFRRRK